MTLTVKKLVEDCMDELSLGVVASHGADERVIEVARIQKPGLALTGYREQLHSDRVLVLGATELEYLASSSSEQRALAVDTLLHATPSCICITRALQPPAELTQGCARANVPLLVSSLPSPDFIVAITSYMQDQLAPQTSMHGVLLDVLGIGVLLLGKSGIGKSETALDLVARGYRLVADDIVTLRRRSKTIIGTGDALIRHHMEIRGLGIVNVKDVFGIAAVRNDKDIDIVIELSAWSPDREYDRLGFEDVFIEILGLKLPLLEVPVRPGRNLATIVEVAARNQLLKQQGHHSAQRFQAQLEKRMQVNDSGRLGDA